MAGADHAPASSRSDGPVPGAFEPDLIDADEADIGFDPGDFGIGPDGQPLGAITDMPPPHSDGGLADGPLPADTMVDTPVDTPVDTVADTAAAQASAGRNQTQLLLKALEARSHRIPPHSIEAEQALLGSLMLGDAEIFDKVSDLVTEADFYQYDHRLIFAAVASLVTGGSNPDVVTVCNWLERRGELEDAGGLYGVGALPEVAPAVGNVRAYAEIVRERSVLRQLISVAGEIAESAYQADGRSSQDLLDEAESKVFSIADQTQRQGGGFHDIRAVLHATVERIDYLFKSGASITGVPTGYKDLDELTSGLQPSDLVIVAGRPSMGKTAFAMNLAENVAMVDKDRRVAVFSMEMPAEQLATRMIASLGRIELSKLRTGRLNEQDWPRVKSAIEMITAKSNIFIDDTPALTPTDLRARARRLARDGGLSLIVVDYLQLMQVPSMKENRTAEVSEISRSMKALAKELHVPIIVLSQLNRSLEQRTDKRPVMSDLRESGAIEQDADVIMFVYRDEVYHPDNEENKGFGEILIRKQRNGPIGEVRLTFLGKYTRFEDYSPEIHGSEFV